ncbi:hypothetical protein B5S30_g3850 [[Candida] boidinii]|nr:hypothetical protein B5S30_g3850 [[Candida] boidinii]
MNMAPSAGVKLEAAEQSQRAVNGASGRKAAREKKREREAGQTVALTVENQAKDKAAVIPGYASVHTFKVLP